jgi:hypothetical protein
VRVLQPDLYSTPHLLAREHCVVSSFVASYFGSPVGSYLEPNSIVDFVSIVGSYLEATSTIAFIVLVGSHPEADSIICLISVVSSDLEGEAELAGEGLHGTQGAAGEQNVAAPGLPAQDLHGHTRPEAPVAKRRLQGLALVALQVHLVQSASHAQTNCLPPINQSKQYKP